MFKKYHKYFCEDAWLSLLQVVECVKKHPMWYSVVCTSGSDGLFTVTLVDITCT